MSIRASDLYQMPQEVVEAIQAALEAAAILRVELTRLENAGQDVSEERALLAAQEAQIALYRDHFGPGSAARYARMARSGEIR